MTISVFQFRCHSNGIADIVPGQVLEVEVAQRLVGADSQMGVEGQQLLKHQGFLSYTRYF